jgi:hypothetical protein
MKTPYLKKNEVCLLYTTFKPTSNQNKNTKVKKKYSILIILNIIKTQKKKKETK